MLSPKLIQTFDFIKQFIEANSYAPTMAEIAEGIGIKSRGVVHRYVQALAEEGFVSLIPGKRRNIRLVARPDDERGIPLLGSIAAGRPIEAISTPETVDIAYMLMGADRYALKVKGDSMIDEGIFEGDLVICEYAETARNGEIVVALINSESATLKQFYKNNDDTITLKPCNATHTPMIFPAREVTVQGIMVGLLRLTH
jgi:repressor LexA